jgi:aldehyde dehydrogenase (NAD+)
MYIRDRLPIGGEWVEPATDEVVDVVNPVSEEVIGRVPGGSAADIDRAVAAARQSFEAGSWRLVSPKERSLVLDRAADLIDARRVELTKLVMDENGSPFVFVDQVQIQRTMGLLRFYAALAREYPFEEDRRNDMGRSLVLREAAGVVATIVPWNSPVHSTMQKIAPALVAGCSVVHKPDLVTPLDAFVVAEIFAEAGLPAGALNIVPGGREAGRHLVAHPEVDKVAFTGSTAAGREIMATCSARIARISLELGGKSAAIVLDDAPLEATVDALLPLAFMNTGQACVAQTRILVSRRRHDEFVEAYGKAVSAMVVGDPQDPAVTIGPLVSALHRDRVESYIAVGKSEGATILCGGGRPLRRGWFVEPTVFVDVNNQMRIAREEIFGPVSCVIPFDDVADAIAIANDSPYGLAGTVWSADTEAGIDVARQVRTGTTSVNGVPQARFTPFGGFKQSGVGREACAETLDMYTETKSIAIPV